MKHVTVYRQSGRYAGWPANYGIWSWDEEIVFGFTLGYYSSAGGFHARDRTRPFRSMQARSLDGGQTWAVEPFPGRTPGGRGFSADEHMVEELSVSAALADPAADGRPTESPGRIDFSHPDFALLCARTGLKPGVRSFLYYSYDRCRSWAGPYWLPDYGQPGIAARTDYMIEGPDRCTLFLTANKSSTGREGRIFCARTTDGGRSFPFLAWIGPMPEGFAIMPASVRLSPDHLLCARRCRGRLPGERQEQTWIDIYDSHDDGRTWSPLSRPVTFARAEHNGNPPTLTRLLDDRLCMTYGDRNGPPYRLCAKLSGDQGLTFGQEIVLRDDGGNHDIGYPRTVQRADGTVVTAYYWNDRPDSERYVAATLWRP